jgi:hypothetical protein
MSYLGGYGGGVKSDFRMKKLKYGQPRKGAE